MPPDRTEEDLRRGLLRGYTLAALIVMAGLLLLLLPFLVAPLIWNGEGLD